MEGEEDKNSCYPAYYLDDEWRAEILSVCLSVCSLSLPGYLPGSGRRSACLHMPTSFWR